MSKLDEAIKAVRVALIFSIEDDDPDVITVPTPALLDLLSEAEAMKKELKAIVTREAWYVEQDRWDEMIPWFDMLPDEKANAIEYWSED